MAIFKYFLNLYRERRQIALLSWIYGVIAVVFVFIAGIFALVNQGLGISILSVPLVAISVLILNVVMWALLRLALDSIEEKKSAEKGSKTTEKKR